ncbi:DsbA family oxidoreductase [Haloarcula nitratireducens]|uniref:DsbA family protein n=1 Tax=Haloarcula nitratireducens TaxID=2487749 RepID=A0AAW4PHE1_9EURY|nr:DsbA family protein [Halomicroarcula nitratireducens]MBX0296936.1 DsbA family protein [Halomicroarcula nitratireducens]
MGSYSGGGGDSSGDDDSQDGETTNNHSQSGLNDYTGDDGNDDSGSDSESGAGGGPPVGPGGSTGGGGGGGGVVTEPPEGDDSGDDGGEDEESEEQEDEGQPESPDVEEPDVEEPEDDVDESDDTEDDDQEDEDDDQEEDEEEEEVLLLVQEVDPLSAMSWCVQPVMKRVEECYGEEIDFFYKPAPVREFEDPEQAKQKWMECSEDMGMPVDPSFWDNDPPESTELVNKAFEAAIQQGQGTDYIRAMWQRSVAAGRNINDEEVLAELAEDLGLDRERFEEDLEEVELETGDRDELPSTFMQLDVRPASWNGRVRYSDFSTEFTFQGIPEEEPQELQGFVEEHGAVATPEVMEVYGIRREEAEQRLRNLDGVSSFEIGGEGFWY